MDSLSSTKGKTRTSSGRNKFMNHSTFLCLILGRKFQLVFIWSPWKLAYSTCNKTNQEQTAVRSITNHICPNSIQFILVLLLEWGRKGDLFCPSKYFLGDQFGKIGDENSKKGDYSNFKTIEIESKAVLPVI